MCMRFIHIKTFRNSKIKYLYRLYNYNKMPITEQEYKNLDDIKRFFSVKKDQLEQFDSENKYYSRLESISREFKDFADREKDIKRRFNRIYLQYGRNNLNGIRNHRSARDLRDDIVILVEHLHNALNIKDKELDNSNNAEKIAVISDFLFIARDTIINLKVMYICLTQDIGLAPSTAVRNDTHPGITDNTIEELVHKPRVDCIKVDNCKLTKEVSNKYPKLTYADRNLALLLDYVKETTEDTRAKAFMDNKIPQYKSLIKYDENDSMFIVPFEKRYEQLIRMNRPRRRGGKNKSRGGRKTKRKGTKKKEVGGYFFSSPEQRFEQKKYQLSNAVDPNRRQSIKNEMIALLDKIPKEDQYAYKLSIPNDGGRTKRRTNNKRKTAKKNNKKKQ